MSSPSLVIRNGTIVDGSGGDPYEADLAVVDGKIAAIGGDIPKGTEEIDARGKLVTPGFVDVHTHYDAQVTWSDRLVALLVERRHDRAVRQLRRGFRALPRRPARHADQPHGRRGRHPRSRAERRSAVELAQLPRFPRCHRRAFLRCRCRRPGAACRPARLCDGRARRQPRARHRAGSPAHGRAHRRRDARRGFGLLDLAHAQSPRRRRAEHPDLARRGSRADRDRPRHARGRDRLATDRVGLRGPAGRDRTYPPAGAGIEPPRHHQPDPVGCPPQWLARTDGGDRRGERTGIADHGADPLAPDQRAARPRALAEPVHGPAELQAHRPSAVPGAPGPAARARVPGPHPGRAVRGQPARRPRRALGSHVSPRRSAGLRAQGRTAASPPGRRGKAARPKKSRTTCCSSATARESCTCP